MIRWSWLDMQSRTGVGSVVANLLVFIMLSGCASIVTSEQWRGCGNLCRVIDYVEISTMSSEITCRCTNDDEYTFKYIDGY